MPSPAPPDTNGDVSASTSDPVRPNGHTAKIGDAAECNMKQAADVSEGDEAPPPPPVPQFTAAEAPVLLGAPTTDSVKVSWPEVTQSGLSGVIPEGASFPECGMEYGLELREVRLWISCPANTLRKPAQD